MTRAADFRKVEGAGNDFVLLDDRGRPGKGRAEKLSARLTRSRIARLLDRHRGVGGDGLLLIEEGRERGVPKVTYWNADGGRAAFCGNGARCVALFLSQESRRSRVDFRFGRRRLAAEVRAAGRVAVRIPRPRFLPLPGFEAPLHGLSLAGLPRPSRPPLETRTEGRILSPSGCAWLDAGVPHWIVPVASVKGADLAASAPAIRAWPALGPGGTNVDLVEMGRGEVRVRTWERGVEGETRACGSGLAASGFYAHAILGVRWPIRLRSRGGDAFLLEPDADVRFLWLEGPAREVFRGRLPLDV